MTRLPTPATYPVPGGGPSTPSNPSPTSPNPWEPTAVPRADHRCAATHRTGADCCRPSGHRGWHAASDDWGVWTWPSEDGDVR